MCISALVCVSEIGTDGRRMHICVSKIELTILSECVNMRERENGVGKRDNKRERMKE